MKVENDFRQTNIRQLKTRQHNGFTNNQQNKSNPNFTGAFDIALRFLDTNQAWGACAVDFGCMVLPRTITDFGRGPDAGLETARREGMGTFNHSMVGVYGALAGLALATGINSIYQFGDKDVKANSIFADAETMDLHGKIYGEEVRAAVNNTNANPLRSYISKTLENYEVKTDTGSWVKLDPKKIEQATNILEEEIKAGTKKINKDAFEQARTLLVSSSSAENNFRIAANGSKEHTSRYTVDYIVENIYKLGKVFSKDKVKETFLKSTEAAENAFVKAIKSMNVKRSLIGIGIASAFGISAQPLNMYLTKLKTGKSGFVGGGEEDKSAGFKFRKGLVASLFGAGVLATIGNPKNLIKDLQFKGFTPTIKQFKFIYGITIMSRFLSSRNDNELKECSIKDTLGFANWLILGNFVQKLVAQKLDPSLIKRDGKGLMNWLGKSVLKTRDEVLHSSLGEKVFGADGKALKYSDMVKLADKATKKKLRILTIAQVAGYAYSGLVLGRGIPKLNIYLTNKRLAKQKQQEQQNAEQKPENMLTPENREFLNQNNFTGKNLLAS